MQEQTTYPALLAIDTIPAPIVQNSTSDKAEPAAADKAFPRAIWVVLALSLLVWVLKHTW